MAQLGRVVQQWLWPRRYCLLRLFAYDNADKDAFSIAVEELTYEGPLRLQVCPVPIVKPCLILLAMSFWAHGIWTADIYVYRHVAAGTCAAFVPPLLPYSTSVAVVSPLYILQIPLPLLANLGTGACAFDLSLPNPEFAVSSLANKLRFITSAISKAAFGKCDEECAASRHAAAVAEAVKSGTDMPLTMVGSWNIPFIQASMQSVNQ